MMTASNNKLLSYLLQGLNYTVFMAIIWYFASAPSIRVIAEDEAVVTIAFGHAGETREPCHKMSSEELAKLAANMRALEDCPRERSPVLIELRMDGELVYNKTLTPPGLFEDGSVNIYYSHKIPAGKHHFEIKMDDSVRSEGFNYAFEQSIDISPSKILLFGFESEKGFFVK